MSRPILAQGTLPADLFKKWIALLSAQQRAVTIDWMPEGLFVSEYGDGHMTGIQTNLHTDDFLEFVPPDLDEDDEEDRIYVCLDMRTLTSVLNTIASSDTLTLYQEPDHLRIDVHDWPSDAKPHVKYTMHLTSLESKEDLMPNGDQEDYVQISLQCSDFFSMCHLANTFDAPMTFEVRGDNELLVTCKSDPSSGRPGIGDFKRTITVNNPRGLHIQPVSFSVKHLLAMQRVEMLTKVLRIRLSNDYPLCVSCSFGEGSYCLYIIAPRHDC